MDDDFINSLYETNKLKLTTAENEASRIAELKKSTRRNLFGKAQKYAQDLNTHASELFNVAMALWNNPSSLERLNFSEIQESDEAAKYQLEVHMGLILSVAYMGHATAAKRFLNLYSRDNTAKDYISKEELEQMHMAAFMYCSETNPAYRDIYRKYETGTQKIGELLISKLQQRIKKGDPDAFFALAQASIKGHGIDRDIKKAYKLLTIAAGLGHKESEKLRQEIGAKFPIFDLSSQADFATEDISSENQVSGSVAGASVGASEKTPASNDLIQVETKIPTGTAVEDGNNRCQPSADLVNPERVCLAMMKEEPYCTIISVADGTVAEWLASLPWDCHLLYEGVFQRENNTVDRCLRLLESNGYPAKSGDLCSAPAHVAMDSLIIATYQLGFERGRLAGY